jgi:hypothetical protein
MNPSLALGESKGNKAMAAMARSLCLAFSQRGGSVYSAIVPDSAKKRCWPLFAAQKNLTVFNFSGKIPWSLPPMSAFLGKPELIFQI